MKDSEMLRRLADVIRDTMGSKAFRDELACLDRVANKLDGVKPCANCNGTGHIGWAEGQTWDEGLASSWCDTCKGTGRVKA